VAQANELLPVLYDELRRLSRARLAGSGHHTFLNTTALVHECFLRLEKAGRLELKERDHFLAYAATTMRSIVIDYLRRRHAKRRGGDAVRITLDVGPAAELGASDEEILQVHEALEKLAKVDERLVRVVEMRYFLGLTDAEVAAALGLTDRAVRHNWEKARLLLAEMLER
jgi:RNA polymerase sigma factor (TIGR02999 family)